MDKNGKLFDLGRREMVGLAVAGIVITAVVTVYTVKQQVKATIKAVIEEPIEVINE